jgi:hypothetical protein
MERFMEINKDLWTGLIEKLSNAFGAVLFVVLILVN